MTQGVPSYRFHATRGTTEASARRTRTRQRSNINNLKSDVIDKNSKGSTSPGKIFVDADGATITFDMSIYTSHQVTLQGNRTLALANVDYPSNQKFFVKLIQDAIGSRTVTWWSGIRWDGGSVPTLSTGANKADWFIFIATGAGTFDGFVGGQNL